MIRFIIVISVLLLFSCDSDYEYENIIGTPTTQEYPTTEEFRQLFRDATESRKQFFTLDPDDSYASFTSNKGVEIMLYPNCFTYSNGESVEGDITVEFIEIFSKGDMLVTNKPTMGLMPDGINKSVLKTGGEFYLNAIQGDSTLVYNCGYSMLIPGDLTGGIDSGMTLWEGLMDENEDLTWEELDEEQENGVFPEGDSYYAFLNQIGWCNVDIFYNWPDPKTTIWVDVPDGYDDTNSGVFLAYMSDELPNGLAYLDVYDEAQEMFTEHYGQIPVGLECYVIFISESDDEYIYAIQEQTIEENEIIYITESELNTITEDQLVDLINNLP